MDKITKLFALAAFSLTAYQQMVLADYRSEWQSDAASASINSRPEQESISRQTMNRDTNNQGKGRYGQKEPSLREERRLLRDERHVIRDEDQLEDSERRLLQDDLRLRQDENRIQEENSRNTPSPKFASPEATPRSYPLADWPPKSSKNDSKTEQYSLSNDNDSDDDSDDSDDNDQDIHADASYHNHMGTPRSYQYDQNERKGDSDSNKETNKRSSYNSDQAPSYARQLIGEAATPAMMHSSKKGHFNRSHETTIVDVATNDPSLSTFIQALQASELSQVLAGRGPFTVFAPDNQAFKKMSPIQLGDLLKPENKQKLATFLKNHVIAGKILVADIKEERVKTANGKELTIKKTGAKVTVNGANVLKTDLTGSNGVVYIIDTVLAP